MSNTLAQLAQAEVAHKPSHRSVKVPVNDTTLTFVWITPAFIVAGFAKCVVGMGLPTVAIGLFSILVASVSAVAILVILSLVRNVWQLVAGPQFRALARRFSSMRPAVCVGTLWASMC